MALFKTLLLFLVLMPCIMCTRNDSAKNPTEVVVENEPTISASCYHANMSECDSTPLITASNDFIDTNRISELRWVAISRDLNKIYKMDDTIIVSGAGEYDGIWIVKDKMNKRFKRKIDFLIPKNKKGRLFKDVKIKTTPSRRQIYYEK